MGFPRLKSGIITDALENGRIKEPLVIIDAFDHFGGAGQGETPLKRDVSARFNPVTDTLLGRRPG
jgi:hypothetical protein